MGTLMASGLMQAGKVLKGKEELDAQGEAAFFEAYFDGVQQRGKAKVGEKTFLDGLWPAVESLKASAEKGSLTAEDAENAAAAAEQAFENTKGMTAVHGRMAIRGEASRELYDPGAAVAMLLMRAYADTKKA
jgi:dihydroxyacetone kinase-like protein